MFVIEQQYESMQKAVDAVKAFAETHGHVLGVPRATTNGFTRCRCEECNGRVDLQRMDQGVRVAANLLPTEC